MGPHRFAFRKKQTLSKVPRRDMSLPLPTPEFIQNQSNVSVFISNIEKRNNSLLSATLLSGLNVKKKKKTGRQKNHEVTLSIYFKSNNLSTLHSL